MRIYYKNLANYLGTTDFQSKRIYGITPLLQNDYGEANDCTLTSITTIIHWQMPAIPVEEIYAQVEQIARKYGYTGNRGTQPLVIKKVYQKSLSVFGIPQDIGSKYLKGICYTYEFIKNQIKENNPVLLNLWKDGNDFYANHTVLIIGYLETNNKRLLMIYDNWYLDISYIDYDKLSLISSINYVL